MSKATILRLTCASAIALSLGACQSLKTAKAPDAQAPSTGPVATLQEAIGGKPALIPVGAPVVANAPTPETAVAASAYAPTSAPATTVANANSARAQVTPPTAPAQAQAKPAQVIPAQTAVAESVPTVPVQASQGPVKTLVDALRGGSAPRAALVPQSPANEVQAVAPPAAPQQAAAPGAAIERPPYDGRVSYQGPNMQTITISPSMPDPRVRDALRAQGAGADLGGVRPPSDSDIKHLF